nr:cysteine synthase [uncultured bacterium]
MNEGILSAIGNTPLVSLQRVFKDLHFRVYAKLEGLNPGGSMKDRPAMSVIKRGLETGEITQDTVVIESSSGNMGIGLAQICSYYGLRFICVVDPKTTAQNIRILEAYGAEIELVSEPDIITGEFLQARIARVQSLLASFKSAFWPDQYANLYNPIAHYQTMDEILKVLGKEVDYLFCAVSTCGTLRGCGEYIENHKLNTEVFAVDAVGSVIFGNRIGKRLIPGHGAAVRPKLYRKGLAHRYIEMTDLDCIIGCRRLACEEAILAGGSSGALIMAIESVKQDIPKDATCVVILPDRGERYLDSIYSDSWVKEHFGDVSHLWKDPQEAQACITMTC